MTKEACLIHIAGRLQKVCHSLLMLIACMCVFWPLILRTQVAAQQGEAARDLFPGRAVEGDLHAGETHFYKVTLNVGDYLRIFINPDPQNTRLRSELLAPGGSRDVGVYFFPTGGRERFVSLIAEESGDHKLEIRPDESDPTLQHYRVTIEELHGATEQDRVHVAAERAEHQGILLTGRMLSVPVETWRQGLEKYKEALALWRKGGDQRGELRMLQSLGNNYLFLGETDTAQEYFTQAIRLAEAVGDDYRQASLIVSFGAIHADNGEPQKALDLFNQARLLFKRLGKKYGEAIAVKNLGYTLMELGDYQDALSYFEEALPTFSSLGDHRSECVIFNSTGQINRFLGDQEKAIQCYKRALSIARTADEVDLEAISLRLLGDVTVESGEPKAALDLYEQSLKTCRAVGQHKGEALALIAIGNVAHLVEDDQKALNSLNQALLISRSMRERAMEASTLYILARVNYSLGNLDEARLHIEQALEIKESIRGHVINQQLRETFFTAVQEAFALYIDLLMQFHSRDRTASYDSKALQANERARARSLLEVLSESQADIHEGVPRDLLQLERSLEGQISARAAARASALNAKSTENQAAYFDKEIAALTIRLGEVEAQIRQQSPRYAALTQPEPLAAAGIAQQLDNDTVLLEFALGERRSWLWAVTRESVNSYQLLPGREIEASAQKVYELLTARQPKAGESEAQYLARAGEADAKYQTQSAALSQMLLGQIAGKLQHEWKDKRLAIVATGALEYLPFAALPAPVPGPDRKSVTPDPKSFRHLITQHEIVNLPSASTLAAIRSETMGRQQADRAVAVVADPVFELTDPRVANAIRNASSRGVVAGVHSRGEARDSADPQASSGLKSDLVRSLRSFTFNNNRGGFSRLPFSREEAEAISLLVPKNSLLKATDFEANRANAISGELSHYRIVHFATHGLLNAEHPELSGLVLSLVDETGKPQDGFLRMYEIYNLKLPADLVVLSACQTALGKEIKGEGLVGLTRGFMYAGAQRVVASLWQVDDLATAQLMKSFYRGMLKERLRPAQALRLAQLEMLKQQRWSSPYFWAPFVIQGEWR